MVICRFLYNDDHGYDYLYCYSIYEGGGIIVENLQEGLVYELRRNRELLEQYKAIGPAGMIGASLIRIDVDNGDKALASGDVELMISAYQTLKGNK